jgi:hypothetical protein
VKINSERIVYSMKPCSKLDFCQVKETIQSFIILITLSEQAFNIVTGVAQLDSNATFEFGTTIPLILDRVLVYKVRSQYEAVTFFI